MSELTLKVPRLLGLGFSLVPKRRDLKAPAVSGWQERRLSKAELVRHLRRLESAGGRHVEEATNPAADRGRRMGAATG